MAEDLKQRIVDAMTEARDLYNQLVIVAGGDAEKLRTPFLDAAEAVNSPTVNISLTLSEKLLDIPAHERKIRAPEFFRETVESAQSDKVFAVETVFLFEPSLQVNPLKLFQKVSRNLTLAVLWEGNVNDGYLEYAVSGHPEHQRFPVNEAGIVINADE